MLNFFKFFTTDLELRGNKICRSCGRLIMAIDIKGDKCSYCEGKK